MIFSYPTDITHSYRKIDRPYICVLKNSDKWIFALDSEEELHDYEQIQKNIIIEHRNIRFKTVTYIIKKQIGIKSWYVHSIGKVHVHVYEPVLEITRSKYEDNLNKDISIIPVEVPDVPKPVRYNQKYVVTGSCTTANTYSLDYLYTTTA